MKIIIFSPVRKMEFRPCIDIHNGRVKQIVGGSLTDESNAVSENYVAEEDAAYFADIYRQAGIRGGHVILLNPVFSPFYEATKEQALQALSAYPDGLQVGGGITPENAEIFLRAGASHVIVTSYVFREGKIDYAGLEEMKAAVGRERLVLDVSCRKKEKGYVVVTDRWQRETKEEVNEELLHTLSDYCDEFLIHAVDVEGKENGIERELAAMLGAYRGIPVTYAGGVHDFEDLRLLKELGKDRVNVTIGSALDIFGGNMPFLDVLSYCAK